MSRPRRFPEGSTARDRARVSIEDLVRAGGRRIAVRLSPQANAALEALRIDGESDTAMINRIRRKRTRFKKSCSPQPFIYTYWFRHHTHSVLK